jgi:hypothetical protein
MINMILTYQRNIGVLANIEPLWDIKLIIVLPSLVRNLDLLIIQDLGRFEPLLPLEILLKGNHIADFEGVTEKVRIQISRQYIGWLCFGLEKSKYYIGKMRHISP